MRTHGVVRVAIWVLFLHLTGCTKVNENYCKTGFMECPNKKETYCNEVTAQCNFKKIDGLTCKSAIECVSGTCFVVCGGFGFDGGGNQIDFSLIDLSNDLSVIGQFCTLATQDTVSGSKPCLCVPETGASVRPLNPSWTTTDGRGTCVFLQTKAYTLLAQQNDWVNYRNVSDSEDSGQNEFRKAGIWYRTDASRVQTLESSFVNNGFLCVEHQTSWGCV